MAEARKRSDYFGTFLETVKQESPEQSAPTPEREAGGGGPSDPPMMILAVLVEKGPIKVSELQEATGMEFGQFGETLAAVVKAGLVSLSGTPGQELADVTDSGRSLASVMPSES
jgi:hypothetical protein